MDRENMYLVSEEVSYLTKRYVQLYKNRMHKVSADKKNAHFQTAVKKEKLGKKFEYKPKISEKN